MSRADERRAEQAAYERDLEADANRRPNIPPTSVPENERCFTGRRHDFSMRGPDKNYRCWTCCKTSAQVEHEAIQRVEREAGQ